MPIEVKNVEWSETEKCIVLKVPLKGASKNNIDIFSTPKYLKVSYPPYFYEIPLFNEIDDELSKATISNGQVIFSLQKTKQSVWGQIHSSQHKDKSFMTELREEAVIYRHKKEEKRIKKINEEKDRQKKYAVREQMRIDAEERKKIELAKKEESERISKDMANWKQISATEEKLHGDKHNEIVEKPQNSCIDASLKANTLERNIEKPKKATPNPRSLGNIQVNFTPRQLPTPARESKLPEEELWLEKVAQMNKIKRGNKDAVDIEEMNPIWLKDKGNGFFKQGNYVAAFNAYTAAVLLDPKVPMLYANRAACHLYLKQFAECIQDCTSALELYDPPVPANALSRCRAFARRGTAYFNLEDYVEALRDYETAIKLDSTNEELKADAYKIRRIIQGGDSSD